MTTSSQPPLLSPLKSNRLSVFDKTVSHSFFTRKGGVSSGLYNSLNISFASQDEPENITENRVRCSLHLGISPDKLVTLAQCHSDTVITINDAMKLPHNQAADALVTQLSDIALGIQTADCAPILFYCPITNTIGATHAGWQGTFKNIHVKTVKTMKNLGANPADIIAVIGPCLHQKSFEVDEQFKMNFIQEHPQSEPYFTRIKNRYHFDNANFIRHGLIACGMAEQSIEILPHDTYADTDNFFSFRRATHNNEPDYGRQLSVITLK